MEQLFAKFLRDNFTPIPIGSISSKEEEIYFSLNYLLKNLLKTKRNTNTNRPKCNSFKRLQDKTKLRKES